MAVLPLDTPPRGPILPVGRALTGADILAFNNALAALAKAGLPLEQGLRLAAADAGSARVRRALTTLAADLEAGHPLPAAFDRNRAAFPPIYARIVEAALVTNNLPAMLLSLGRHQLTLERLRASLSRSLFYPLLVLLALAAIATLIGTLILPQMSEVYRMITDTPVPMWSWRRMAARPSLPYSTLMVMSAAPYLPAITIGLLVTGLLVPVMTVALRLLRMEAAVADAVVIRLPLIGPAIRHSALARFTDLLAISVRSGLDLPRALRLAGDTVGYPRLRADAEAVAAAIESGQSPASVGGLRILPQTTASALSLIAGGATALADALASLALLHQQQAEVRAGRVPVVLLPVSLLLLAGVVAILMAAIVAPLSTALRAVMA